MILFLNITNSLGYVLFISLHTSDYSYVTLLTLVLLISTDIVLEHSTFKLQNN